MALLNTTPSFESLTPLFAIMFPPDNFEYFHASFWSHSFTDFQERKKSPKPLYLQEFLAFKRAGTEGLEPSTFGFGDQRSTN